MARHHGVVYVEGVAIFIVDGRPHLHAWCADSEGRVLDRTRDDGICYFGVPVRIDFLQAVIFGRIRRLGEPYFGLLDDWQGGYFLINQLGNEPEKWLAE